MPNSELTIEAIKWSMNLETKRAEIASKNISSGAVNSGNAMQIDLERAWSDFRTYLFDGALAVEQHNTQAYFDRYIGASGGTRDTNAYDHQITELSSSELRFRTMSEVLSRHMALLTLATTGKQGA